jgi:hypothetical protein
MLFANTTPVQDSEQLSDGDRMFRQMISRSRSTPLPEGVVELSKNMRLERNEAAVRLGLKKLTDDQQFSTPITLPFTLPSGPLTSGQTFAMYASGVYSDPNSDNDEYIVLASTQEATFWSETRPSFVIPYSGYETVEDEDQAFLIQANYQVFIYRGWEGDFRSIVSITRSGATATVTSTAPHGLFNGQMARVSGATQPEYNGDFIVTVSGPNAYSYTVTGSPASPATGTLGFRKLKAPLRWDGDRTGTFMPVVQADLEGGLADQPNADYGLYFADRMIQPYSRNQVILSDILDIQTWDLVNNQASFLQGSADYTVGLHPYQENQILVYMRKSIHLLLGVNAIDLTGSKQVEVTREVGCCARRSIQTAGDQIFWLSDNGVYSLTIGQELNLVGKGFPLSEPVSDYFARVNTLQVDSAVGIYHDNRYYIAVPLDGAERNNYVFVYNTLNQGWESVDTFPAGLFIDDLLVSTYGNRRRVFATNREGAIYLFEEAESDETGTVASPTENQIDGQLWTRPYWLNGNNSTKRFEKFTVHGESTAAGDTVTVTAAARNPDSQTTVKTYVSSADDDFSLRGRVGGKRGNSCSLRIVATAGRPVIRSTAIDGIDYDFSTRNT